MELRKAKDIAIQLIHKYLPNYKFSFDNAVRRFGMCNRSKKEISISRYLTALNDEKEVINTILHEIAHGLCSKGGHTDEFYKKCVEIGAVPKRTYDSAQVTIPKGKHIYKCIKCGKIVTYHRLLKKEISCAICNPKCYDKTCKFEKVN